jgi:hypothetical protein
MNTFPFTIQNVQVECAHCSHQLGEKKPVEASFGLDVIRCDNCRKFTQVTSRVETARVQTPVRASE